MNAASVDLDQRSTLDMLRIINREDGLVASVVATRLSEVAQVVDVTAARMAAGGRLVYVGAGTSGRLAMLDAAECVPTFGVDPSRVVALIAGGEEALTRAVEGAEDDGAAGIAAIRTAGVAPNDTVVGISASGRAAYVREALAEAGRRGAFTVFLTCGAESWPADVTISVHVGPEVIAGSTRLKAGTAQKMVLNMISTGVMIRLGRTFGNQMVQVRPTNTKLRQRATRLVAELADVDEKRAGDALADVDWDVQRAVLELRLGSRDAVELLLARHGGNAKRALEEVMRPAVPDCFPPRPG